MERLLRWWGVLFRMMFIAAVALVSYHLLDPPSISDKPISSLSLRDISKNILAWLIVIVCFSWFFQFPDEEEQILSYEDWGKFGAWVIAGIVLIVAFATEN